MSEALRQLNSLSFVITLQGTEKLKASPAVRVKLVLPIKKFPGFVRGGFLKRKNMYFYLVW